MVCSNSILLLYPADSEKQKPAQAFKTVNFPRKTEVFPKNYPQLIGERGYHATTGCVFQENFSKKLYKGYSQADSIEFLLPTLQIR